MFLEGRRFTFASLVALFRIRYFSFAQAHVAFSRNLRLELPFESRTACSWRFFGSRGLNPSRSSHARALRPCLLSFVEVKLQCHQIELKALRFDPQGP